VAHVNLIPFNPWEGAPVEGTPREGIRRFARILEDEGIPTTIRWSRGVDVGAACGQLALKQTGGLSFDVLKKGSPGPAPTTKAPAPGSAPPSDRR